MASMDAGNPSITSPLLPKMSPGATSSSSSSGGATAAHAGSSSSSKDRASHADGHALPYMGLVSAVAYGGMAVAMNFVNKFTMMVRKVF